MKKMLDVPDNDFVKYHLTKAWFHVFFDCHQQNHLLVKWSPFRNISLFSLIECAMSKVLFPIHLSFPCSWQLTNLVLVLNQTKRSLLQTLFFRETVRLQKTQCEISVFFRVLVLWRLIRNSLVVCFILYANATVLMKRKFQKWLSVWWTILPNGLHSPNSLLTGWMESWDRKCSAVCALKRHYCSIYFFKKKGQKNWVQFWPFSTMPHLHDHPCASCVHILWKCFGGVIPCDVT